jgi:hypothetical protein
MARRNACLQAVQDELARAGIRPNSIVHTGGGHIRICWQVNGHEQHMTVPFTASDWRAPHNARAEVRRKLRSNGGYNK